MEIPFKTFLKTNRNEYLFPVLLPVVVFVIAAFTTNIGWIALPAGLTVVLFMGVLTTLKLYNRWWMIESIMRTIEAEYRSDSRPG